MRVHILRSPVHGSAIGLCFRVETLRCFFVIGGGRSV